MILWPKEILERLDEVQKELREIEFRQRFTDFNIEVMAKILGAIESELHQLLHGKAVSAVLKFVDSKGALMANSQSVHINDAPGSVLFQEFDGQNGSGNLVPAIGPVSFVSDNPAVATVDPNTGQLAYISAGSANITGTDAGNGLTASLALSISNAVAQSATLTFVPPAAQAAKA